MSVLSDFTDNKALKIIAKMVIDFEELNNLNMTKIDAFEATQAKNLLRGIVESAGYEIDYENKKKSILKS